MIVKKHEKQLKTMLNINPKIYYGSEAKEKLRTVLGKNGLKYNGFYNPPANEIYIKNVNKRAIGTLAHEMRHVYQFNYKYDEFIFHEDWYNLNDPMYSCRKTELDANLFALRYCKENKLGIFITFCYYWRFFKIKMTRKLHKLAKKHICE